MSHSQKYIVTMTKDNLISEVEVWWLSLKLLSTLTQTRSLSGHPIYPYTTIPSNIIIENCIFNQDRFDDIVFVKFKLVSLFFNNFPYSSHKKKPLTKLAQNHTVF